MLLTIFDLGQHITNFGLKIFNNDCDASHYLHISSWLDTVMPQASALYLCHAGLCPRFYHYLLHLPTERWPG